MKGTPEERFWAKVDKADPNACWLWTGNLNGDGYGRLWVDGRMVSAHVFAYATFVGPIPEGLEIDHVRAKGCRHRHCVNYEEHLEAVTQQENIRRGEAGDQHNAAKTHCPAGHAYDEANTYLYRGWRRCRACNRARDQAYRLRKKAAA